MDALEVAPAPVPPTTYAVTGIATDPLLLAVAVVPAAATLVAGQG